MIKTNEHYNYYLTDEKETKTSSQLFKTLNFLNAIFFLKYIADNFERVFTCFVYNRPGTNLETSTKPHTKVNNYSTFMMMNKQKHR